MLMRIITAMAVLVSGYVHLHLWLDGMRDASVVGPMFMLNAVGSVAIAVLLVLWKHWAPLLLAVGFGASTIVAFTIAATVGLFGVQESWTGVWVWSSLIAEAVAVLAGLLAAWREGYLASGLHLQLHPAASRPQLH